jgi:hypothetical protein
MYLYAVSGLSLRGYANDRKSDVVSNFMTRFVINDIML